MTTDENARFGELRSLLHQHQRPDTSVWEALCALLEGWPEPGKSERALPYARAQMGQWPDEARVTPRGWWRR